MQSNSEILLSDTEAYAAMIEFLEMHYRSTGSRDIAALLSEASLAGDCATADQANWNRWQRCVSLVVSKRADTEAK